MNNKLSSHLLSLVLWLGFAVAVQADYTQQSPRDLVFASIDSPSSVERGIMRRYLADHHKLKPEGLFARGWLAAVEGRQEESIDLYRQAYNSDRSLTPAGFNLAVGLRDQGRNESYCQIWCTASGRVPV